jgi:ribosomal protein S27AE
MTIEELQAKQGWTDATLGVLARQWLHLYDHDNAFLEYLAKVAEVEAEMDEEMDAEDEDGIEGDECPNCQNGTLAPDGERFVCRGECGQYLTLADIERIEGTRAELIAQCGERPNE